MPHCGSVLVTSTKALWASSYQKECRTATARLNCCCAAPLHDTIKLTRPSFSPISCLCCSGSCAFGVSGKRSKTRDTPRKNLLSFITVSISNALMPIKSVHVSLIIRAAGPPERSRRQPAEVRLDRCCAGRSLVNNFAANHRHQAMRLQDFHLGNLHDIGGQHRQVGKLSNFNRTAQ